MKTISRRFAGFVFALALLAALGTRGLASQIKLTQNPYSYGVGGEFTAKSSSLGIPSGYDSKATYNGGFETFCLEYNEEFYPGVAYSYGISGAAISGGVVGGSDPISIGTAWLYSQFAAGVLAGYNYNTDGIHAADRARSAGALQNTFWWLEGEGFFAYDATNVFAKAVVDKYLSEAAAKADSNGAYGVAVVNLGSPTTNARYQNQDQLVLVPDNGTTLGLLGIALVGLAGLRRRFARSA